MSFSIFGTHKIWGILSCGLLSQVNFSWVILSWGILSLGDFVMGAFVTGDFVMGDFDPIPTVAIKAEYLSFSFLFTHIFNSFEILCSKHQD